MTNCGPGGGGTESCCTSLEVTGGTYYRSYTNNGAGPTGEADPATVSTFRLDLYDVTVGRFRQFVNIVLPPNGGAGWLPSPSSGKHTYLNGGKGLANSGDPGTYEPGWVATDDSNIAPTDTNLGCDANFATWTASPGNQESLPINCVNWWEAYAFCIWDGGFLPSDAESEYAAAGGSQQREYPWGSTAPGTACPGTGCQYAIYNCEYPSGTQTCAGVANIAPVGTATQGAALSGQFDLAGNVFEWNLDWYAAYAACTDCAAVTAASYRVIRGGSFINSASNLRPPHRDGDTSTIRDYVVGLRCSRTP
jgi:formylglycine-generating enzyme